MSLNNSQYDTLIRQYNARQFHNQHLLDERIQEVLRLIDIQLATVPNNPIEESYKARTLASYVQALNGLLTAQKSYKEENNE